MTPRFILPTDYADRDMTLVLAPKPFGRGWEFRGVADGYSVAALNHHHKPLFEGEVLRTKQEAAIMARALNLPPYAIWNGRKRKYEGEGATIRAYPRNAPGRTHKAYS